MSRPKRVKLYRHPDAAGRVGIPAEGEWFDVDDAERLVGQGIATRTRPRAAGGPVKPARSVVAGEAGPERVAKEG